MIFFRRVLRKDGFPNSIGLNWGCLDENRLPTKWKAKQHVKIDYLAPLNEQMSTTQNMYLLQKTVGNTFVFKDFQRASIDKECSALSSRFFAFDRKCRLNDLALSFDGQRINLPGLRQMNNTVEC